MADQPVAVAIIQDSDFLLSPTAAWLSQVEQEMGHLLPIMAQDSQLAQRLCRKKEDFAMRRKPFEAEWLQAYQAYMSQYTAEELAKIEPGKSRLYVGLTAMKCNSAYASILDFLRGNGQEIPFGLDPEKVPDDLPIPEDKAAAGVTVQTIRDILKKGAQAHETEIVNQFDAADFPEKIALYALDMVVPGSGGMIGPVTVKNERKQWEYDLTADNPAGAAAGLLQEVDPEFPYRPDMQYVPIFNVFPDLDAPTVQLGSGVFVDMPMTRGQMMDMAKRPGIDTAAVLQVLRTSPRNNGNYYEFEAAFRAVMGDVAPTQETRYVVTRYFGEVTGEDLAGTGLITIPPENYNLAVRAEVWFCESQILSVKILEGPIPVYITPYMRRGNMPFGKGIPMLSRNSQAAINGAARATMDQAALAAGGWVELNKRLMKLDIGEDDPLDLHGWKVWVSDHSGESGMKAVHIYDFPAKTEPFLMILDKFRQLMDEETFLPSLTQGLQGVGVTKTVGGMSLLNTNANKTLKQVMMQIDDTLIEPMVEAFKDWNYRFNPRADIRVPCRATARGSASLLAAEVRSQRLLTLLQIMIQNPNWNVDEVIARLARDLGVNPDELRMTEQDKLALLEGQMKLQAILARERAELLPAPGVGPHGPTGDQPAGPPGMPATHEPALMEMGGADGSRNGTP